MTRPILLAGPTASGKSALALALAERLGGTVVNADSQQVYADWRVLTARPTAEEEALVPHRLYGHLPLEAEFSVGAWLRALAPVLAECRATGRVPVIAGGTGLYFKALTEGLSEIPPTPAEVRAEAGATLERLGLAGLAAALAARDPETAAGIDLANPMRVLRAWEVLETTGRGLADWRRTRAAPLVPLAAATALVVLPERRWLHARCEARFDAMLAGGALAEAGAVLARRLPPGLPGMKAVGAPELMAHLRGETDLATARAAAIAATRRYAKRQLTWARNQMADWTPLAPGDLATALRAATAP